MKTENIIAVETDVGWWTRRFNFNMTLSTSPNTGIGWTPINNGYSERRPTVRVKQKFSSYKRSLLTGNDVVTALT